MWNYSENTIRRLFRNEPGVLKIGNPETRFRRKYFKLSIPESLLMRIHQQKSK